MTSVVNNMLGPAPLIKPIGDKVCTQKNGIVLEWQREPNIKQAVFLGFLILIRLDDQGNLFFGTVNHKGTQLKPENVNAIRFDAENSLFFAIAVDAVYFYEWIPSLFKLKLKLHQKRPGMTLTLLLLTSTLLKVRWDYPEKAHKNPYLPETTTIYLSSLTISETGHCNSPEDLVVETPNPELAGQHPAAPPAAQNAPLNLILSSSTTAAAPSDCPPLAAIDLTQVDLSPSFVCQLPFLLKQNKIAEDTFVSAQAEKVQNRQQIEVLMRNLSGLMEYRVLRHMFARHYLLTRNHERIGQEIQANQVARRGVLVEPICKLCKTEAGKKTLWQLANTLESTGNREFRGQAEDQQHWLINRSTVNQNRRVSGHVSCYLRSAYKSQEAWEQIKKAQALSKRQAEVTELLSQAAKTSAFGRSLCCRKQPPDTEPTHFS